MVNTQKNSFPAGSWKWLWNSLLYAFIRNRLMSQSYAMPEILNSGIPEIRISGFPEFRKSGFPGFRISG